MLHVHPIISADSTVASAGGDYRMVILYLKDIHKSILKKRFKRCVSIDYPCMYFLTKVEVQTQSAIKKIKRKWQISCAFVV
jgi:hypothetical protein